MFTICMQQTSKNAEGYPDNATILFKTTPVSDFVMGDTYNTILREANQLVFDRSSEVFSRHPLTTEEIRENCRDLRVLGASEFERLLKWRKKMRQFLEEVGEEGEEGGKEGEEGEEEGLEEIDEKVKALANKESADVKRLVEQASTV